METIKEVAGYLGVILIAVILIIYGTNGGGEGWMTTGITLFSGFFGINVGIAVEEKISNAKIAKMKVDMELEAIKKLRV